METKEAVAALGALAQPTRLGIFRLLVTAGPEGIAAGVISEKLGLPPATLSFHLKALDHAGLVAARQSGRYVIYCAEFGAMTGLIEYLTENCCGGRSCASRDAPQAAPRRRVAG